MLQSTYLGRELFRSLARVMQLSENIGGEGNRLDTQASPANKNKFWATERSQKPGIVPKS